MKIIDTCSPEAIALKATCLLHIELLDDQGFTGYYGSKDAFDQLYSELLVIARDKVSLEVELVDQVVETFYQYQLEISEGQREVNWYL